jgi:hypothetical protein
LPERERLQCGAGDCADGDKPGDRCELRFPSDHSDVGRGCGKPGFGRRRLENLANLFEVAILSEVARKLQP